MEQQPDPPPGRAPETPPETLPATPPGAPPGTPLDAEAIARVVATFYAEVRRHPTLGPVFARHVADWPAHEARIAAFWRNAILRERGYDGNPMAVHRAAGNVRPGMFPAWLALFDAVLARELPPPTARAWSALAHRIGRGLSLGLQAYGGMPNLRGGP
ncbi:group III truncated hemoglobin [Pseudogemmobacter sonorensis]|uniref:group III truncated hemoglobin n=1 Tax=Pseudogemmobacter sonorensis TaxID=2989681 RepID=UPI0036963D55